MPDYDHDLEMDENGIPIMDEQPTGQAGTGTMFEGIIVPEEHPKAVDQWGTTSREQELDEPIEQRTWREQPEVKPGDLDDGLDLSERPDDQVGHLMAPDSGIDTPDIEKQEVAIDTGIGDQALSSEEQAMHLTEAPPMGDGDGYLTS